MIGEFGVTRRLDGSPVRLAALSLLFLFGLVASPQPARAADAALLRDKHIVFVEPYGPNSVTNLPLMLMRAEIERKSGASVEVMPMGGRAGGTTLDYLINAPKGGAKDTLVFGVLDLISRQLAETVGERPALLKAVQPVALVSAGTSVALIVAEQSPVKSIDDFLAQARAKPLRLVHLGRKAAFGLELAMLEKGFGLAFTDKVVGTRAEILAALASGEADAGFLVTYTLLPSSQVAAPPVRPILTFGAKRNPKLADVPTLKERTRDPKAAITSAIAVFAPRSTPKDIVAAMAAVMEEVAVEPEIKSAAASRNFPLDVRPAAAVIKEMKRGARIIKQHRDYLNR